MVGGVGLTDDLLNLADTETVESKVYRFEILGLERAGRGEGLTHGLEDVKALGVGGQVECNLFLEPAAAFKLPGEFIVSINCAYNNNCLLLDCFHL